MNYGNKIHRFRNVIATLCAGAFLTVQPVYAQVQDTEIASTSSDAGTESAPAGSVGGMGDINLFPRRIVLNGPRQIATIGLYNKTANDGDYELNIIDKIMTEEGRLIDLETDEAGNPIGDVATASAFLRHSPRRVTLGGSESQTVRVMARAGSDLPDGEYRSHFMALSVPDDDGTSFSIEDALGNETSDSIGVQIQPRFGISIPIIVRIGETTLDVTLSDARLLTARDGSQAVSFTINRSGTRSAYGDILISAKGASKPVALAKGIGIYPEVDKRTTIIPIDPETDPQFLQSGSALQIIFTDDDYEPGSVLAEHRFVIP